MNTPTLGEPRFASARSHTISDDLRIPERIEIAQIQDFSSSLRARAPSSSSIRNKRGRVS
jgi:hypothetical protein